MHSLPVLRADILWDNVHYTGKPIARVVGGPDAVALKGDYDPAQAWFPFMAGTILLPSSAERAPPPNHPHTGDGAKALARGANRVFAKTPKGSKALYKIDPKVPQMLLPFVEGRKLHEQNYIAYEMAGLPGWERTASGEPCEIRYEPAGMDLVRQWCAEFCQHPYYVGRDRAVFSNRTEATVAKLTHHAPARRAA